MDYRYLRKLDASTFFEFNISLAIKKQFQESLFRIIKTTYTVSLMMFTSLEFDLNFSQYLQGPKRWESTS